MFTKNHFKIIVKIIIIIIICRKEYKILSFFEANIYLVRFFQNNRVIIHKRSF